MILRADVSDVDRNLNAEGIDENSSISWKLFLKMWRKSPLCKQKQSVRRCAARPEKWMFQHWCCPGGTSGSTEPPTQFLKGRNDQIWSFFIRLFIYPLRYSHTVVTVRHCGVFGKAWVKVGHQWSDVLSSCEHLVDYISSVDETWKRKTYWGFQHFSQKCHLIYQTWHFAFWDIIFV